MPTSRPNDAPEREGDGWPADLTDQELELDRVLAEITVRRGPAATMYVGEALMRRFF